MINFTTGSSRDAPIKIISTIFLAHNLQTRIEMSIIWLDIID